MITTDELGIRKLPVGSLLFHEYYCTVVCSDSVAVDLAQGVTIGVCPPIPDIN